MSLADTNQTRANRLDDELRMDDPVLFPGGPQSAQVLSQPVVTRRDLRPLEVETVSKTRREYRIGTAGLENLPLLYKGQPVDDATLFTFPPETRLAARFRVRWHRDTMQFQELDGAEIKLRTRTYKTGEYDVLDAEVLELKKDDPAEDETQPSGFGLIDDFVVDDSIPEVYYIPLGETDREGAFSPVGLTGLPFLSHNFTLNLF